MTIFAASPLGIEWSLVFNLGLVTIIVILVIASLIGLWKGIWKTSFKLIFRSVLFLIMVLCAAPISNAICRTDLSFFGAELGGIQLKNIDQFLAEILVTSGKISPLAGQSLYETCFSLGHSLASFGIFFLLMILTVIFGSLFATLFYHTCFKFFVPKKLRKKKKLRLFGTLFGLLDGVLCTVMFISPLSSIVNVVNKHSDVFDALYDKKILDDNLYSLIKGGLDGYNQSALFSTMKVINPISSSIMNQVIEIEVNGVKIGFLKELDGLLDLAKPLIDSFDKVGTGSLDFATLLSKATVSELLKILGSSKLIVNMIPGLISMGQNLVADPTIAGVISTLDFSDIDWSDEIGAIDQFYAKLYDTGLFDKVSGSNILLSFDLARIAEYQNALKEVLNIKSIEQNLSAAMVFCANTVNKSFNANIFATDISAYESVDWANDLTILIESLTYLLDAFKIDNFNNINFDMIFQSALKDPSSLESLSFALVGGVKDNKTIKGILDLDLISTAVDVPALALIMLQAIPELNGYINSSELISIFKKPGFSIKDEFRVLLDILPLVLDNPKLPLNGLDLANQEQLDELKKVVNSMGESKILLNLFPGFMKSSLKNANITDSMLFGLKVEDLSFRFDTASEFKKELNIVLNLVNSAMSLSSSLSDSSLSSAQIIKNLDLDQFKTVLLGMYNSKILNPSHRVDGSEKVVVNQNFHALIKGVLSQEALVNAGITIPNDLNRVVWLDNGSTKGEISNIIAAMQMIKDDSSFFLSEAITFDKIQGDQISKILSVLGRSEIFSYSLPSIFNKNVAPILSDLGVKVDFAMVKDWKNEGECLGKIIDSFKSITSSGSLENIDWLNSDIVRVNSILTAFSQTEIMGVHQDQTGRYVDNFGNLLAKVFTDANFKGVLGSSINSSFFQVADPVNGELNRGWKWVDSISDETILIAGQSESVTVTKTGEIANLISLLEKIQSCGVDQITSGNLDAKLLGDLLKTMLNTNTLDSIVPDMLRSAINNVAPITLDADNVIDISTLNTAVFSAFTAEEAEFEVDQLVKIYAEFVSDNLSGLLKDVNNLNDNATEVLSNLLDLMASLKTFTSNKPGERLSLYDSVISSLMNYISLDQMVTNNIANNNNLDAKSKAKAEMISIITSIDDWLDVGTGAQVVIGENTKLVNFIKTIRGIDLTKLNDAASLNPTQLWKILKSMNPSQLLHQAIPTFFEQAFAAFHIDEMIKIDGKVYYPINYRQHLSTSVEDVTFWDKEIDSFAQLATNLYDETQGKYLDSSQLGFGNGTFDLYNLLGPIDHLSILSSNKEYIVYKLIFNTDSNSTNKSLTEMIRDQLSFASEHIKAARIRKLFFPIGHTDADLKLQCDILSSFLSSMANSLDTSFHGTSSLSGEAAFDFILSTMVLDYDQTSTTTKMTRSLFASELVSSFLRDGFMGVIDASSVSATEKEAFRTFINDFFFIEDETGRSYKNLNIVEAYGIRGLLDLAKATDITSMKAAIAKMGYNATTLDQLAPTDANSSLLKATHKRYYQDTSAGNRCFNSQLALRLFNLYCPANLTLIINQLSGDLKPGSPNFVFENLANALTII